MFGAFDPHFCVTCAKDGRLQTLATKKDESEKVFKVCPTCGSTYGYMDTFTLEDIIYILWIAVAMMQEDDNSVVPAAVGRWLHIQGKEVVV